MYQGCIVAWFRGYQLNLLAFSLAETSGHLITKYTGYLKNTAPVHTLQLAFRTPSCLPCRIKRPKKAGFLSGVMGSVPDFAGTQCILTLLHAEPPETATYQAQLWSDRTKGSKNVGIGPASALCFFPTAVL